MYVLAPFLLVSICYSCTTLARKPVRNRLGSCTAVQPYLHFCRRLATVYLCMCAERERALPAPCTVVHARYTPTPSNTRATTHARRA